MPIKLNEEAGGKILIISVTGKLSREDYKSFVPKVEELILKFGKIRMVLEMRDFHGWDADALCTPLIMPRSGSFLDLFPV